MKKPRIGLLATVSEGYHKMMDFPDKLLPDYERLLSLTNDKIDWVTPGLVMMSDELDNAVKLFQSSKLEGLAVYHVCYTHDEYTLKVMEQLNSIPVCFLLAQGHEGVTDDFNVREYFKGWQSNSFIQITATMRRLYPDVHQYSVVGGLDERTTSELSRWANSVSALNRFRGTQFAYLPSHCMHMYDTWADDAELMRMFKSRFVSVGGGAFRELEVDQDAVELAVKEVYERFEVIEPTREQIKDDMKSYFQAKQLIAKGSFAGIADNHLIGNIGASYLMDEGLAMSAEGDMGGVVLARYLMDVSGQRIQCFEHLSYDLDKNWIVGGHNSFGPMSLARDTEKIQIRATKFGKQNEAGEWVSGGVALDFAIKPGTVTLAGFGMSESGNFVIRAVRGESVDTLYHELRMPYAIVQLKDTDVRTYFKQLAAWGGGHHFVLVHGDYIEELRILAEMLKVSILVQ